MINNLSIDDRINRLFRENLIIKYNNNVWSKEDLLENLMNLEYQLNEKDRLLEKNKYEIMKLKQIIIEKESEISEKKIVLSNLKNQKTFENEEKIDQNTKRTLNWTKITKDNQPSQRNECSRENQREIKEKAEDEDNNFEDLSIDEINNSIIKSIKNNRLRKTESKYINSSKDVRTKNLNQVTNAYNELISDYNDKLSDLNEKTKIIDTLYSEINYWKKDNKINISPKVKIDTNIKLTNYNLLFRDSIISIKEDLIDFLKSWKINIDLNSISFSNNYSDDNQITMLIKEVKYLIVNLKRIKIQFKIDLREFSNNIQKIENNYIFHLNQKLDFLNKKIKNFQSNLEI